MNLVLLLNRDMGSCHQPTLIQGWGGEQIGVSRYSTKHNCHIFDMPVDAYNKVAQSLMRASHIALRRWEPQFVEETVPDAVREFWDGWNAGMDGHPENYSSMAGYFESGFRGAFLDSNPNLSKEKGAKKLVFGDIPEPEPVTAQTHHKTLERIARDESIDLSGIHGTAAKAQAIIEARGEKIAA